MSLFMPHPRTLALPAVPASTWALRAQAGTVPQGFVGLQVNAGGHLGQTVRAGQKLMVDKQAVNTQLWWVRDAGWDMTFAPDPELAAEAGLGIRLEAFTDNGGYQFVASWLGGLGEDVTAETMADQWRAHACIRSLPPCAPQSLLDDRRHRFLNVYAVKAYGLRVRGLWRVDLPAPPIAEGSAEASDVSPNRAPVNHSVPDVTPSATDRLADVPWSTVASQDRRACQRLAAELPRLTNFLSAHWGQSGWHVGGSIDYQLQRALWQRLSLLGGKFGQSVSVTQQFAKGAPTTDWQRRLIAAAGLHAEQALGDCWAVLELMLPGQVPDAKLLRALQRAVDHLEHEVNRRLNAWWEIEP